MKFIFANTGIENEQTLQFVQHCSAHFGFPVTWVEAKTFPNMRKGTSYKVVDYQTAARDGEPFEEVIKKYGIPNSAYPHCTRELKLAPIHAYIKALGWKKYHTAIGIRTDEFDRMNAKRISNRFIYPLISIRPMTKATINFWWAQQPFRLELKGYQGNCTTCWKKSDKKLFQIAKENERSFVFMAKMEARYSKFIPYSRLKKILSLGELPKYPIRFFRKNRSSIDMINESKKWNGTINDDSEVYDQESCEVFASDC